VIRTSVHVVLEETDKEETDKSQIYENAETVGFYDDCCGFLGRSRL